MISVSLHQVELPKVFAEFAAIIGAEHWTRVADKVNSELQAKPYLRAHLESENSLALQLARCSEEASANRGVLPPRLAADVSLYPAFAFLKQTVELIKAAERKSRKRARSLTRRVQAAFQEPYEILAMQLEAMVATHFLLRGKTVRWPELEDGPENYDLLIDDQGPKGLEVDVKSSLKTRAEGFIVKTRSYSLRRSDQVLRHSCLPSAGALR